MNSWHGDAIIIQSQHNHSLTGSRKWVFLGQTIRIHAHLSLVHLLTAACPISAELITLLFALVLPSRQFAALRVFLHNSLHERTRISSPVSCWFEAFSRWSYLILFLCFPHKSVVINAPNLSFDASSKRLVKERCHSDYTTIRHKGI